MLRYRCCEVDGRKGYFHRWCDYSHVVEPSALMGGHNGGVVRGTCALIEDEKTGQIFKAPPEKVVFLRGPEL